MREYNVRIREVLEKTVTVEAKSAEHARAIVEKGWINSDYILDASHFQRVTFAVPQRSERSR